MNAGDLKQRIIIQSPVKTRNSVNENVITWETWKTVWAAIEPAVGSTYYAAKQANAEVDGRVRIRYVEGLEPTYRILWGERVLNIVSIIEPKMDKREIVIMYSEALD